MRRKSDIKISICRSIRRLQIQIKKRRDEVIDNITSAYYKKYWFIPKWDWTMEINEDNEIQRLYKDIEEKIVYLKNLSTFKSDFGVVSSETPKF